MPNFGIFPREMRLCKLGTTLKDEEAEVWLQLRDWKTTHAFLWHAISTACLSVRFYAERCAAGKKFHTQALKIERNGRQLELVHAAHECT